MPESQRKAHSTSIFAGCYDDWAYQQGGISTVGNAGFNKE
jgi:hypothetical protein